MNKIVLFSLLVFMTTFSACNSPDKDYRQRIDSKIQKGNFSAARQIIDSARKKTSPPETAQLQFLKDSLHRIELDFGRTKGEVVEWIEKNRGFTPTDSLLNEWEASKALEFRIIDGEKRYFRNAAPNVFRVNASARELSKNAAPKSDTPRDALLVDAFNHKTATDTKGKYLLPQKTVKINYTLTVKADAVADGETLYAWLPFPRKDIHRQTDVKLLATSQPDYVLSEDQTQHTSVYMEQKAEKGKPTVFSIDFEFSSHGEWFDLSEIEVMPYDSSAYSYKAYTSERKPHIGFSGNIKKITDSVTQNARTPVENLQAIYRYIAANYPWASALEYSTIANIPEYVIENSKGDCGQVALLLITMLRYKGIPARWQSGWMTHPGEVNLHDWAEVYFEGTGWIPVDISFGRGGAISIKPSREFFMSGIDSYRLYINSDFSAKFFPRKRFPRSETVDFQRGEVETGSRNLYFDEWDYKMIVTYK
ncbi:MAG: transglutaminase-like domain-containing protein [Bacteroidia bacterium]|nr:transglutaminase-like domain-containing protein [Bacteroidia bacterium]